MQPLAQRLNIAIELNPDLGRHAGVASLELVGKLLNTDDPSPVIVLCTHRETIVDMLPALAKERHVSLGHRLPGAKGACWMITFQAGQPVRVKYWCPNR
jgi:hypothetical protein